MVKYRKTVRLGGGVCVECVYVYVIFSEDAFYFEKNPTAHKTSVDFNAIFNSRKVFSFVGHHLFSPVCMVSKSTLKPLCFGAHVEY